MIAVFRDLSAYVLECASKAFNILEGGCLISVPKRGSRMHVFIKGSLNGLHCCGNKTPAANEDRLVCFLDRKSSKEYCGARL